MLNIVPMAFGILMVIILYCMVFQTVIGQVLLMIERVLHDICSTLVQMQFHGVRKNNRPLLYHLQRLNTWLLLQQLVKQYG